MQEAETETETVVIIHHSTIFLLSNQDLFSSQDGLQTMLKTNNKWSHALKRLFSINQRRNVQPRASKLPPF